MKKFIVIHDNGISGQKGYSEELALNPDDVIKSYSAHGVTIFEIYEER